MTGSKNSDRSNLPLDGIKVVELGQNAAGPYAGAILASLGADVLKIERPVGGDDARSWNTTAGGTGTSTTFEALNRAKRSVVVDLAKPDQLEDLKRLIATCDVLVHNMRPGVMERLGFGSDALCRANPRLVYCSISAFGNTGPLKQKAGYEPVVQAFSGLFSVNGGGRIGVPILDLGTGIWGALGCIAALFRRNVTGSGGVVDASLLETALAWLQLAVAGFNATGALPERHESGNTNIIPFQAFDAEDGQILIAAANDRLFAKLVVALGRPDLASDPRFKSNADRFLHRNALIPLLQSIFRKKPVAYWNDLLESSDVPSSPIHNLQQLLASRHIRDLGIVQTVPQSTLSIVGLPLSFDGSRPAIHARAPSLGEHTVEILGGRRNLQDGSRAKGFPSIES